MSDKEIIQLAVLIGELKALLESKNAKIAELEAKLALGKGKK